MAYSTSPAARQAYLLSIRRSSKATFTPPSSSSPWAKGPDYIAHSRFLVARMRYIGYYVLKTYDQYASLHKARRDLDALDCKEKGTYLIVYRQRLTINPLVWLLCIYVGSTHMQTIADRNRYHAAKLKQSWKQRRRAMQTPSRQLRDRRRTCTGCASWSRLYTSSCARRHSPRPGRSLS